MKLQKLFGPVSLKLSHFLLLSILTTPAIAFDGGSTGSDGAFAPVSSTTIVLPPDGILNFTTMNIPSGVTVRIASNLSNSPAFILVQGDAVIDGIIDISGVDGDAVSSNPAGGFAGGLPLQVTSGNGLGGNGQGPGGGPGGTPSSPAANGGGFGASGGIAQAGNRPASSAYGSTTLQPLLGGSGGGASISAPTIPGQKGGGGAGAVLIAVSGVLTLTGSIDASGGYGTPTTGTSGLLYGSGGGSGGGVRLIATTITGNGTIAIEGGAAGVGTNRIGGAGALGRARLEADIFTFTGTVTPNVVATSAPLPVFAANLPTIRISTIGGSAVPANPIGENDVILPSSIVNPVTVEFAATDVPLGSTVELTLSPASGVSTTLYDLCTKEEEEDECRA